MNVTVSKLMISIVDSKFTSTCMGKESETLIFVFDVCHTEIKTKLNLRKINLKKTTENYLKDRKVILESSGEYQCLFCAVIWKSR